MLERNKLKKKKSGAKNDSGTVKWRFFTAPEFLNDQVRSWTAYKLTWPAALYNLGSGRGAVASRWECNVECVCYWLRDVTTWCDSLHCSLKPLLSILYALYALRVIVVFVSVCLFVCLFVCLYDFFDCSINNKYSNKNPAGGVGRNRDSEPISGFSVCCYHCERPGVINTVPPYHRPANCDTYSL